jgi:SAM-dependent methyltransferase
MTKEGALGDNEAQVQYWNSTAGERWVRHQAFIDQQLTAVTDLLLQAAAPKSGEAVLDVGCGTGATLLRLAAAVDNEGRVLGCDVSAPMLALARQRIAAAGVNNADIIEADAQSHRFPEATVDLLVSRFGVMFFANPTAAFANLRRPLKHGGRLAFVCWAALADNPFLLLPIQIATRYVGPLEPTPPRAPGPFAFSEPEYVSDILTNAGWSNVLIQEQRPPLLGRVTAQEQAAFSIEMGPVSRLIAERQPDTATVTALQAELTKELATYATERGVELPSRLYYVTARA